MAAAIKLEVSILTLATDGDIDNGRMSENSRSIRELSTTFCAIGLRIWVSSSTGCRRLSWYRGATRNHPPWIAPPGSGAEPCMVIRLSRTRSLWSVAWTSSSGISCD